MDLFQVITHLGTAVLGSALTVFILYKFFDANKLMMRKPPLGVVSDSLRYLFVRLRPRKYVYNYWEIGDRIGWIDWHRGFGYGYMDEDDQPKPGDMIQVRVKSNKKKYKGKVQRLIFYKVEQPDETIPSLFTFRTIYAGMFDERRPEKDEEIGGRFRSFQRLT